MMISLVFFLSWTPVVVYCFAYDFFRSLFFVRTSINTTGYAMTLLLGLTSSVTNPIIYTICNENFKLIAGQKLPSFKFLNVFHYESY